MKHDHKKKIETLNEILQEYSKYFIYFDTCKCYDVGERFVIRFKSDGNRNTIEHLTRKIPRKDIDLIIARYRSKLYKEKEKVTKTVTIRNIPEQLLNVKFFWYEIN